MASMVPLGEKIEGSGEPHIIDSGEFFPSLHLLGDKTKALGAMTVGDEATITVKVKLVRETISEDEEDTPISA